MVNAVGLEPAAVRLVGSNPTGATHVEVINGEYIEASDSVRCIYMLGCQPEHEITSASDYLFGQTASRGL